MTLGGVAELGIGVLQTTCRGFGTRVASPHVRDLLGETASLMHRENMHVDLGFRGPEEIRTPDLTRASGAEVIYGYSRAFTFSIISAGQSAVAAHAYSHLLPPASDGAVRDLFGQIEQGAPETSWLERTCGGLSG